MSTLRIMFRVSFPLAWGLFSANLRSDGQGPIEENNVQCTD
jgi:hypothetical protein